MDRMMDRKVEDKARSLTDLMDRKLNEGMDNMKRVIDDKVEDT